MGVQASTQLLLAFGVLQNMHSPHSSCVECPSGADSSLPLCAARAGAGTAVGTAGGGFVAQWLYNRHKWHMPLLMGVTTISVSLCAPVR